MSAIAVTLIDAYRNHLSPLKGFRCAHDVLWDRGSCSTYGLKVFKRFSDTTAVQLMLRRFRECREAAKTLSAVRVGKAKATLDRGRRKWAARRTWCADATGDCIGQVPGGIADAAADAACDCGGGICP